METRNGLLQFDEVCRLVSESANPGTIALDPALLRHLQQIAIQDIYICAGHFRNGAVTISNTIHQPPPHGRVAWLVQEMCDTANQRTDWPPLRTAAYLLWRLNWIHPFFGGNGRTSRAVSYYALCARLGFVLPGIQTIPELITQTRPYYYAALDQADIADREQTLALGLMEDYLRGLLAKQLLSTPDAEDRAEFLEEILELASANP